MATTTGTANSHLHLITEIRDFLTGLSPTMSWAVLRDTSTSPVGANSPNTTEIIFEGDASNGGSPSRKFYWGMRSYETPASSVFGVEIRGFTGFDDGSPSGSVAFENQPDASPPVYTPMQNTPMSYWIWANARRVIVVINTGTAYQWIHAGFLDPFATETEYPYPMMVMGSTFDSTVAFNNNSIDFSTLTDPAGNSAENPILSATAPMWARFTDGQWYPIKNFRKAGTVTAVLSKRGVWPLAEYTPANYPFGAVSSSALRDWRAQFYAVSQGGTPPAVLAQTPGSPDDISPLLPLTILMNDPSMQLLGEISGIYWVSSSGGVTAEDEIFDHGVSPAQKYLVFQNIHRTDSWSFAAVKDE